MRETKQVIVMRTDLNMRKGKMIAQGAHASLAFITKDVSLYALKREAQHADDTHYGIFGVSDVEKKWLEDSFTKICVGVSSLDELHLIHDRAYYAGIEAHIVYDKGLTEFGGVKTATCVAIGPDYADKIDPITGHLKLL